jgi:hypothetical protein
MKMNGCTTKCDDCPDEAAQPAQEPVATIAVRWHEPVGKVAYVLEVNLPVGIHNLYTTPPQRPLVGLTDADWKEIEDMPDTFDQGVAWCLTRLKRKNA